MIYGQPIPALQIRTKQARSLKEYLIAALVGAGSMGVATGGLTQYRHNQRVDQMGQARESDLDELQSNLAQGVRDVIPQTTAAGNRLAYHMNPSGDVMVPEGYFDEYYKRKDEHQNYINPPSGALSAGMLGAGVGALGGLSITAIADLLGL